MELTLKCSQKVETLNLFEGKNQSAELCVARSSCQLCALINKYTKCRVARSVIKCQQVNELKLEVYEKPVQSQG